MKTPTLTVISTLIKLDNLKSSDLEQKLLEMNPIDFEQLNSLLFIAEKLKTKINSSTGISV